VEDKAKGQGKDEEQDYCNQYFALAVYYRRPIYKVYLKMVIWILFNYAHECSTMCINDLLIGI
jgi:hypothetical protein